MRPLSGRKQFSAKGLTSGQNFLYGEGEDEEKPESKNTKTISFSSRPKQPVVNDPNPIEKKPINRELEANSSLQSEQPFLSFNTKNDAYFNEGFAG